MHIRETLYIEAAPARVLESARTWMRRELQGTDIAIQETTDDSGTGGIASTIDQDGIELTTTVTVAPHESGAAATLDLRTQGRGKRDKLRNLTLLPGRKLVKGQVRTSLLEIRRITEEQ